MRTLSRKLGVARTCSSRWTDVALAHTRLHAVPGSQKHPRHDLQVCSRSEAVTLPRPLSIRRSRLTIFTFHGSGRAEPSGRALPAPHRSVSKINEATRRVKPSAARTCRCVATDVQDHGLVGFWLHKAATADAASCTAPDSIAGLPQPHPSAEH